MKKRFFRVQQNILVLTAVILFASLASAQFVDDFNDKSLNIDPKGVRGWTFRTGDGLAVINFSELGMGYATINVDATKDKRGIWWAIIRRCVSQDMDLSLLSKPNYEFRIEARIKASSAPKRVNLHLNTQRTTDFHSHLMEYDIPDTANWHTISMTTHNFDALPGDTVYGQLALMDWGLDKYRIDVDYFKVSIVNITEAGSDEGVKVPYHPPLPEISVFENHILVDHDAVIDREYPEVNFKNWSTIENHLTVELITISNTQYAILKWNLEKFSGKEIVGSGLLELTTYSLQRSSGFNKDFGMIRVSEIIGGDKNWNRNSVTYEKFLAGKELEDVVNSQMIVDIEVNRQKDGKNLIAISNPVLQRMTDGKTLGLAIKPLGSIIASFYSMDNNIENVKAKLHFNIKKNDSNRGLNK